MLQWKSWFFFNLGYFHFDHRRGREKRIYWHHIKIKRDPPLLFLVKFLMCANWLTTQRAKTWAALSRCRSSEGCCWWPFVSHQSMLRGMQKAMWTSILINELLFTSSTIILGRKIQTIHLLDRHLWFFLREIIFSFLYVMDEVTCTSSTYYDKFPLRLPFRFL